MKSTFTLLASFIVWYAIISFIIWNPIIPTWHWSARALLIVFTLFSYSRNYVKSH